MSHRQVGRRARVRASLLVLALATFGFGAIADSAVAVPAQFWGVAPQTLPPKDVFQRLHRGGVDSLRFPIEWAAIESVKGSPDWSYVDSYVAATAEAGIEPLPFLNGAPEWAVRSVSVNRACGCTAPLNLPVRSDEQRSGWQRFLREAVGRYGPGGSFWSAHPGLPQRPIRTWQIWNEPNFKYFAAHPNPAEYGKLVKLSYTAIKGVDRGARLVLAGLFAVPKEAQGKYKKMKPRPAFLATEFLKGMYRSTPGIKSKFQGIALHPYSIYFHELKPEIEDVRRVLREAGDGGKQLWITELGWSSKPPPADNSNLFAKGPKGQVRELKGAFKVLERNQAKWKLKRVFWFSVDDHAGFCNFCDGSGLFTESFAPKASWSAYVKFAGGTP